MEYFGSNEYNEHKETQLQIFVPDNDFTPEKKKAMAEASWIEKNLLDGPLPDNNIKLYLVFEFFIYLFMKHEVTIFAHGLCSRSTRSTRMVIRLVMSLMCYSLCNYDGKRSR